MNTGNRPFKRLRVGDGFAVFQERNWQILAVIPLVTVPCLGIGLYQYRVPASSPNPPELWQLGALAGAVLLITALLLLTLGRSLRIDSEGVTERFLFRTRFLSWRQIRDYGFSYAGFGRARLYFAEERLEPGSDGRRQDTGRCCGILLFRSEIKRSGEILNVCRQYTRVRPYLCTEDGQLPGKLKDR